MSFVTKITKVNDMVETTQNIIRTKYSELIRLISLISDEVRIEDRWTKLSLTIDVYSNKRRLLSFKLYQLLETDNSLSIEWEAMGRNVGHWTFPDSFNQRYMFDKLVTVITNWYHDVINSNLDNILKQAQDKIKNIVLTSDYKKV